MIILLRRLGRKGEHHYMSKLMYNDNLKEEAYVSAYGSIIDFNYKNILTGCELTVSELEKAQ